MFVEEWTAPRIKKKRPRNQAKDFIVTFLGDKHLKRRKEIVKHVLSKMAVGKATIENARDELLKEGRICKPKTGFYKLKEDCKSCKWWKTCRMAGPKVL